LVGVQSDASPFFYELYYHDSQAGAVELESLADGLAGAVEEGSLTIPMVQRYVNEFVLVTEEQIARAIAYAWHNYAEKIEGSAATTLAAVLNGALQGPRPFVAVISGGNIQPQVHEQICAQTAAG
jgi:threonine dehydratase